MAYVGSESEFMITILDMVPHIISTIVRHLESRDTEITDKEWNFFFYNLARDTYMVLRARTDVCKDISI